jgi:alpha-L-fucosidase 2
MQRFTHRVRLGCTASLLWTSFALPAAAQSPLALRYDRPARAFEESLPLGNGRIGAAVFGGARTERVLLNDITLWSGRPVNLAAVPDTKDQLQVVRDALSAQQWARGDSLVKRIQGPFTQSYAPLGDLAVTMTHGDVVQAYTRVLDLATATSTVRYDANGVTYTRRTWVSHPDQVLVMQLTASKPRALAFRLGVSSLLAHAVATRGDTLTLRGEAPVHAEPSYRGAMPNAIRYDSGKGTRFAVRARIVRTDGVVTATGGTIDVDDASQATVLVSIATSFDGYDKEPGLAGRDEVGITRTQLASAAALTADTLHARHVRDVSALFGRVTLDLGPDPAPELTTDARLQRYTRGEADPYLETLYFQYGRYLLISSSRTPNVPANLQGLWNPHVRPPWSANYTTNINAEMNYWPAEVTALPELHESLLGFIGNLAVTGKVTAERMWGARGWSAGHNSDIWATSMPVGDYGTGDPEWANWPMGGAWLATHLWEHFAFTQDREFLRTTAYPLMVGAAQFGLDMLVPGPDGTLVTSPSTSPENRYRTPAGYVGATTFGATADLAILRELFTKTIAAGTLLGIDAPFRAQLQQTLRRMTPYRVGANGALQEWYFDWADADPKHRHQSHLFGLYPGTTITPQRTPALAAAARRTLEMKGDRSTGWSQAWRINLWARLGDGERAHALYRQLLTYVDPVSGPSMGEGGGTYPNLFDAHPPFQIDGNFGGTAGVAEMLLQSHSGVLQVLPALPPAWRSGSVRGLRARGGYAVDITWRDGTPNSVTVHAFRDGPVQVAFGTRVQRVMLTAGASKVLRDF